MPIAIKHMIIMYMLWYVLHILASHLYIKYCIPLTFHGMILAPFITTASHCVILRWTIMNGGTAPMVVWGMVIVWISKFMIPAN